MAKETMREIMAGVEHVGKPRIVANNTVEYMKPSGERVIRLHHTDILTINGHSVTLDSGGWQTVTTKDRLNSLNPYRNVKVYSGRGQWFVYDHIGAAGDGRQKVPFFDGIKLIDGKLPAADKKLAKIEKANAKLAAQIRAFVKRLDKIPAGELPQPSSGDCWYCSMFDRIESAAQHRPHQPGDGTGSRSHDPSHLLEHVKEGYLHGSLLVNAMRWAGWTDQRIGLVYHSAAFDPKHVDAKRALRRFLRSQLGLPV